MSTNNHDECGCGHDHEHDHEFVTLTLDDGTELKCSVLSVFPVNDKEYIALLPIDSEDDSEEGEVYIYRLIDDGSDEPILENIEDDDEFEAVADAFDELLDSEEFDEFFEDEDLEDLEDLEEE